MKKLAIAFIICLIPFLCNAGMNPYVAGAIPTAASSCSVDNDEIGTRVDTTNADTSKDVAKCFLEVADCSGTLAKGFIADYYTTTWTAKICIYSYDNDAPDDGDGRLSCSGVITAYLSMSIVQTYSTAELTVAKRGRFITWEHQVFMPILQKTLVGHGTRQRVIQLPVLM